MESSAQKRLEYKGDLKLLDVTVLKEPGNCALFLRGRAEGVDASQFQSYIEAVCPDSQFNYLVNLARLSYMASTGEGIITQLSDNANRGKKRVIVIPDGKGKILGNLEAKGITSVENIRVCRTLEEAAQELSVSEGFKKSLEEIAEEHVIMGVKIGSSFSTPEQEILGACYSSEKPSDKGIPKLKDMKDGKVTKEEFREAVEKYNEEHNIWSKRVKDEAAKLEELYTLVSKVSGPNELVILSYPRHAVLAYKFLKDIFGGLGLFSELERRDMITGSRLEFIAKELIENVQQHGYDYRIGPVHLTYDNDPLLGPRIDITHFGRKSKSPLKVMGYTITWRRRSEEGVKIGGLGLSGIRDMINDVYSRNNAYSQCRCEVSLGGKAIETPTVRKVMNIFSRSPNVSINYTPGEGAITSIFLKRPKPQESF